MRDVFGATLVLSLGLGAMTPAAGQLAIGAKGGINIADMSIEGNGVTEPTNSRTGMLAAGFVQYAVQPWLSLQLEARYTQKGTTQPQGDGIDALLRTSYAEVPLTVRLAIPTGGAVRPFFYGGGFMAFEVSCGLVAEGAGVSLDIGCGEQAERNKCDYGVVFGVGSDFAVGPVVLTLDAEYGMGLRNVVTDPDATAYHRVFSVAAGFKVPLGRGHTR